MMDGDVDEQLVSRSYQSQLEEIAVSKNTIIHLPTGSGKTFIAIRLINRFRRSLKDPWGHGGKRTFFLVNTIPLVNQQKKVITSLCAVKSVAGYSGEDGIDYWDKNKWDAELSEHQVIVMTSQILADMLTHSYIRIEDINLLIFDECHHAVDDHPMRLVMKHFEGCPVAIQPRVLGLTATLLNANVSIHKVEETLRELETTFHATIATVNELGEVLNYSTNPNEHISIYHSSPPVPEAAEAIEILEELLTVILNIKLPKVSGDSNIKLERWQRDISTDPKKIVKEVKNMIVSIITFIEELGVYGGSISIIAYTILLERLKRKAISKEEEQLYKIAITNVTMARKILINIMEKDTGYDRIIKHSSEKILHLLSILKEFNPEYYKKPTAPMKVNIARQPLSGIIFTKQRFTAKVLFNLLKEVTNVNPEFKFLKHDFIVGFNINPFKNTREQYYAKKASQTALLKFANKELNCLISTSVIEEGVDIPQCLLVLRYDPPLEYRSYIQSKGRARSSDSTFVLMVNAIEKDKFMKQYHGFQETENYIQKILVGNTDYRGAPSQENIEDGLYNDDEIPPYITTHGARLSSVQAISLLNRYCSVLPHDQFTVITPMWIEERISDKRGEMRQIKIYMPIACPIKDIISGEPKFQLKAAKRSAALNACITLHEAGELDYNSLLPRQFGTVDFDEPDVQVCFPNWPSDKNEKEGVGIPRPGTKKRVRKHKKVFPAYLRGLGRLSEDQKFYLHIIQMKTTFTEPKDSRENSLYQLLQDESGYGFLTLQALPKLCDFPLFLTVGEINTSIKVNYAVIQLNSKLFSLMKRFHYFLFDQVLEVAKTYIAFDGTENCMYVVPVKRFTNMGIEQYDIDWTVIHTYTEIRPAIEPTPEERKAIRVRQENYKYHVVSPWYRGFILPSRYIVSNVLEYMTPYSQFSSNPDDGTFVDYYSSKYNLNILGDKNQPLLEVRSINSRYNCLMPRAASINAFTEKQLKMINLAQGEDKPKEFPEVLIPEFCILYDFPGVLWYKATIIPSVIHRVFMLLVAYELRAEIAKQAKIGLVHLFPGQEWKPIEVNIQVAADSLWSLVEDPLPKQCIDRINNPIDEEAPCPVNIVTMKQSLYELQRKKISQEYSWDENTEPLDIERNITSVTVMDVECYDEFVSTPMAAVMDAKSPIRSPPRKPAAIMPPPVQKTVEIMILGNKLSARGPELRDILKSITTIKTHDTFNLERAETLGDSFLKFASSLYLYHRFPTVNEGVLTNIKGRLLGNRNLYYAGLKVCLGGRMKVEQFSPKSEFLVPGFFVPRKIQELFEAKKVRPTSLIGIQLSQEEILSGELSKESWEMVIQKLSCDENTSEEESVSAHVPMQCYMRAQAVADKSIADCVESLIGTYLLSDGILGAVKFIEWLKVFPPEHNFESMLTKQLPTVLMERKTTEEEVNRIMNDCREDIETILNYKFKDPSYLLEALSHVSYIRNRITRSYERLEFLGDAILDFLITSHIFESCPDLKPGDLTDLRSALVNNVTFASYVVRLGIHKFICYQLNPVLETAIMTFIDHQERRDHNIVEDILYLIDEEDCQIAEYVEVPKVLSDIFESLAGAIYLDSGGNLEAVWAVYYRIMCREIHSFSRRIPQQPVRVLYEKVHACPEFGKAKVSEKFSHKVMIPVTVTKNGKQITVHGFGGNKFQAKRAAAKLALKVLGI